MKTALCALNSLEKQGIVDQYAIGGAIAASFYIEAVNTEDIDAFIFLSPKEGSMLLSLSPIYDALVKIGGVIEKGYVRFGRWPVQILPAYNPLVEEAIRESKSVDFAGIPTRIFTPEYLCAISLDTGRIKDYYRVSMFIEQLAVDVNALISLVNRFDLSDKTKNVLNWELIENGIHRPTA